MRGRGKRRSLDSIEISSRLSFEKAGIIFNDKTSCSNIKTIYSNIKFFIFQLICILAKMGVTFEPVGICSCGFRCCTHENKFCHLNHVLKVFYARNSLT